MINGAVNWHAAGRPDLRNKSINELQFVVEGDDGFTSSRVDAEALRRVSQEMGLSLDIIPGDVELIGFIGRKFGFVKGKLVTFCDPERALAKWHLSAQTAGVCTPAGLLRAKSLSYLATDRHTPLVGAIAWACARRTRGADWTSARKLYMRKILSGAVPIDALDEVPPALQRELVPNVAYHLGVSIKTVKDHHAQWINYGLNISKRPPAIRREPSLYIWATKRQVAPSL